MAMYPCLSLPSLSFPTLTGSIVTFNSQYAGLPLKSHKIALTATQSGSGTPSPSNPRPISGYSAINIGSDDKYAGFINFNQLAGLSRVNTQTSANVTFTKNNDNSYTISGTANGRVLTSTVVIDRFYTVTGHKYLFNISESITPLRLREQNNSLPFISGSTVVNCSEGKNAYFTFDSTVDISGISFNVSNLYINIFDLTVMFGSTKADEIYNMEQQTAGSGVAYVRSLFPNNYYDYNAGTLTTVSAVNGVSNSMFTIQIGSTVYGGEYDARSGVLICNWAKANTSTMNWYLSASGLFVSTTLVGIIKNNTSAYTPSPYIKCSAFESVDSAGITGPQGPNPSPNGVFAENTEGVVYFNLTSETTIEGFKAFMSDKQFIYELATPTTIQLPPCPIDTLEGVNNIWSDVGNTTLQYPKFG